MKRETKEGGNLREEEESISQKEEKVACVISQYRDGWNFLDAKAESTSDEQDQS